MNTTNTPDRDEVMPSKSILADLHIMLTHPESKLNEWERKAVASAKSLLEQDKEDGKRLDWLSFQTYLHVQAISVHGRRLQTAEVESMEDTFRKAVDSAIATTTEKGEA